MVVVAARIICARVLLLAGLLLATGGAQAHLLSAGQGAINLLGDQLVVLIGVPVGILKGVDDNADGLLQPEEIRRHQPAILEQLGKGMTISVEGLAGTVAHDDLMVSVHVDDNKSTNQLEWGRRIHIPGLAGSKDPVRVRLNWYDAALADSAQQSYSIQVRRVDEVETAMLGPQHPEHTFLAGRWGTLQSFLRHGVEHILLGADHLLFVITLLSAGVNLRRWIGLLTAFTLAHGMTYSLSANGIFYAPEQIIEPLIAATIVGVSLLRLADIRLHLAWEAAMVFVFGLVHGLGFALAMANLSSAARFPVMSVLGFNLGVELGQVLIATSLFAVVRLTREGSLISDRLPWQKLIAGASALTGAVWLWQRIQG